MLNDGGSKSRLCLAMKNLDLSCAPTETEGCAQRRRIQISAILNNKDPDLSYAQLGGRVEWDPAKRSEKEVRLSGTQPSVNVDKLDEQMGR